MNAIVQDLISSPSPLTPVGGAGTAFGTLALAGECQIYRRNAEIVAEGARADRVYRVLSGAVRTVRLLEDGRRQIGAFYLPGEVFGLGVCDRHTFSAEAVTDTGVAAVRRDRLLLARAGTAAGDAVLDLLVGELARAQDRFVTLGRRSAVERVVSFLLEMEARTGARSVVSLPMCRQDIADFLGLTIETVSRTMAQLERDGVIALPSARRVEFRNCARLRQLEGN